ncbi:MAG: UvrD-helicase domain-containing protein [Candidatus Bathyarchaeia archaeon]
MSLQKVLYFGCEEQIGVRLLDIGLQTLLVLVPVTAGAILFFVLRRKQRLARLIQKLVEKHEEIVQAIASFHSLLASDGYLSKLDCSLWHEKWDYLSPLVEEGSKRKTGIEYPEKLKELWSIFENGGSLIKRKNEEYVKSELAKFKTFFDDFEANPLTERQRQAIVIEEKHNLVVAGAGTGKTSTLLGKAGYILQKKLAESDEILLIAFARKVRDELEERTLRKLGREIAIETFHSLGLDIIADVEKRKLSVSELSTDKLKLQNAILRFIKERLGDPKFLQRIVEYFAFYATPYKSMFDFKSKGEYIDYLRNQEVRSLKGDLVKSLEECNIANFLYMNGIDYSYERDYEANVASRQRRQYKPDFYLPKYGVYIEHFGVDRNGNTAPFVDREKYLEDMSWKKRTHQENGTKLIETFSWEASEEVLLDNLESHLAAFGVEFAPIPEEKMFDKLNKLGLIHPFAGLLGSFLNLFKSSQKSFQELLEQVKTQSDRERNKAFIEIFSEIYAEYQKSLGDEIDFNDMINRAEQHVSSGSYHSKFKYILVDEFQDISYNRYKLLKALLSNNLHSRLFAVGDDWQSIYRFTGSDVSIMTDFNQHFDPSECLELDRTFRFSDRICDFSSKFILKNPSQIRKKLTSNIKSEGPAVTLLWSDNTEDSIKEALHRIKSSEKNGTRVLIIGRYNHQQPSNLDVLRRMFQGLDINYITAHSSKGKESDCAIVIGLTSQGYAFPSQIEDDPVLNLVLAKKEPVPNAEERRLFYVAVTRARKHVYLIANRTNPSVFAAEVANPEYDIEIDGDEAEASTACPSCKTGLIIQRQGKMGTFYSCSNYPHCEYKPRQCPRCGTGFLHESKESSALYVCSNSNCSFKTIKCPRCKDGYLVLRKGRYSQFFGCSNYPDCRYTQSNR